MASLSCQRWNPNAAGGIGFARMAGRGTGTFRRSRLVRVPGAVTPTTIVRVDSATQPRNMGLAHAIQDGERLFVLEARLPKNRRAGARAESRR